MCEREREGESVCVSSNRELTPLPPQCFLREGEECVCERERERERGRECV